MRIILLLVLCWVATPLRSQSQPQQSQSEPLTITRCYEQARANYPLLQRAELIAQSREFNLRNARTATYPQLGLSGKATYQTEVPSMPSMPPFIAKDQYNLTAEASQSIWDGGSTRALKQAIEAGAEVENRSLEVDLYTLHERIDNLFFGILMLDEQLSINQLLDQELHRNLKQVESLLGSGLANQADVDAVQVELLSNKQHRAQITSTRGAYIAMLSAMVGEPIQRLTRPAMPTVSKEIKSVELAHFDALVTQAEVQKRSINARLNPKISAFVQGAYGQPGLNFLHGGFSPYALGGIKMSWSFGGLYTRKSDLALIDVQKNNIQVQRRTFLFNTDLTLTQLDGEARRLIEQMGDDEQIIRLRGNIKRSSEARVVGGTMSVTDMLREVTAENTAILEKQLHEVELLKTLYTLKTKTNN